VNYSRGEASGATNLSWRETDQHDSSGEATVREMVGTLRMKKAVALMLSVVATGRDTSGQVSARHHEL
jgi:hypothetical protein